MQDTKIESHIYFAHKFNRDGSATEINLEKLENCFASDELSWVHLNSENQHTREWLKKPLLELDDLIIDALLARQTRPRVSYFGKGVLIILRGINLNKGAKPEDMVSLRLWIEEYRIITVQKRKFFSLKDICHSLEEGKGPSNSADFIIMLLNNVFNKIEPVLTELDESVDIVEQMVLESPETHERKLINDIRKKAIMLKRYIVPQKEAITALRHIEANWIHIHHRLKVQESLDKLIRYIEDLDEIRERTQVVRDELVNSLSQRLNRNIFILSVVTVVFMPLSFLTGLLGINVQGIPGATHEYGFWIFSFILLIILFSELYIIKKLKWI
jgi:zinc transporter